MISRTYNRPTSAARLFSRTGKLGCVALLTVAVVACSSSDDAPAPVFGETDTAASGDMTGADGDAMLCVPEFGSSNVLATSTIDPANTDREILAFVAERASDFTSGQIERLSVSQGNIVTGAYPATGSDIDVNTDGESVYQIGRFQLDSVTRFSPLDTSTAVYQRSVAGDEVAPNPYQIVFASPAKAYVIRYGSPKIWIVDPSAEDDANFKTGEIDISAYDVDGVPEASEAAIIGDSLYVLMERLENFTAVKNGYIAVFDINAENNAEAERETCMGQADGLKGIPLTVRNPNALQFSEATGSLFVMGRGNFFATDASAGNRYTGGIETIDLQTYAVSLVADDGTEEANEGFFSDLIVVSAEQAYVQTLAGFDETTFSSINTLRSLNLVSGELGDVVAGLNNLELTTLAMGPLGNVWVGLGDPVAPGFVRVQPGDGSIQGEQVATTLVPISVVFVQP